MREEVGFGNVPASLGSTLRPSVKPSALSNRDYDDEDNNVEMDSDIHSFT